MLNLGPPALNPLKPLILKLRFSNCSGFSGPPPTASVGTTRRNMNPRAVGSAFEHRPLNALCAKGAIR